MRDKDGKKIEDPAPPSDASARGRRVDFIVLNSDGTVDSVVEVTGPNVSKAVQQAKEDRIRQFGESNGGVFIRLPGTDTLVDITKIPTQTRTKP